MPCKPSSATTVESASWSWTPVLPFWMRRPNTTATRIRTGSQRQDEEGKVDVQRQHDDDRARPGSAIWLSRLVMVVVSTVRIWVTSLDSRETRSPTRRTA